MKVLILLVPFSMAFQVSAQSSTNEILRVAQLRQDCVERSKCEVNVFPNPSTGPVHIDAPRGASCQVYSSAGTYVGTWEVGDSGLDLTDLPSGTFIASVNYNGINRISRIVIL